MNTIQVLNLYFIKNNIYLAISKSNFTFHYVIGRGGFGRVLFNNTIIF